MLKFAHIFGAASTHKTLPTNGLRVSYVYVSLTTYIPWRSRNIKRIYVKQMQFI